MDQFQFTSKTPFDVLREHFKRHARNVFVDEEKQLVQCAINAGGIVVPALQARIVTPMLLLITMRYPFAIPSDRRPAVAEAITRANFHLIQGHFEMNFDDGDLSFCNHAHIIDDELKEDHILAAMLPAMASVERYFPAIARVLFTDIEPWLAIDSAECADRREEEDSEDEKDEPLGEDDHPIFDQITILQSEPQRPDETFEEFFDRVRTERRHERRRLKIQAQNRERALREEHGLGGAGDGEVGSAGRDSE